MPKTLSSPSSVASFLMAFHFFMGGTTGVLPPQSPPWPSTYSVTESLITMQQNASGWSSPERAAQFGIVSYDWGNLKGVWAAAKPMNCEHLLTVQALRAKAAGTPHVFVYRNIVKALPWFASVRKKLNDPAYAGFFLKFDSHQRPFHVPDCAAENQSHCSTFYHDQQQTPQVPTAQTPHPNGKCVDYCDCGDHPCGEYLFDHRNGTMLRDFLVNDVVLGALLPNLIDGMFLDDYWCSNLLCEDDPTIAGCPCDDPAQGPTEINAHSQEDMGLTDQDIREITVEWNVTMTAIQQALLDKKAYTWSLIAGQENANAKPILLSQDECQALLQEACQEESSWQTLPVLFGFSVVNGTILKQLEQDLAFFLLARGDYAWAGWGVWGMTWPFNRGVPLPGEFFVDYGVPTDRVCKEVAPGIFARQWSLASVQLDCNTFHASIDAFPGNGHGMSVVTDQ